MKNACWDNPKPLWRTEETYGEQKAEYPDEILGNGRRKEIDRWKDETAPTQRYGAYLRKMAIDGFIIYTDTTDIKEMNKILSAISRNINQIAKRANAGAPIYEADMQEIKERQEEIWRL